MRDMKPTFEVIERPVKTDKSGQFEFRSHPDYQRPLSPEMARFVAEVGEMLTEFRERWRANHEGWAQGLELDVIPFFTDGMVAGFLAISESDGKSYDYYPAVSVSAEDGESK